MLAPKRETIRSKQLSLPGDKQTDFDRFLEKQKEAERLKGGGARLMKAGPLQAVRFSFHINFCNVEIKRNHSLIRVVF